MSKKAMGKGIAVRSSCRTSKMNKKEALRVNLGRLKYFKSKSKLIKKFGEPCDVRESCQNNRYSRRQDEAFRS
jgi:hypothetical protein